MTLLHGFPDTLRTWIGERLGQETLPDVNHYVMDVYAAPLQQLCRSRLHMDAETALDLVHGFFAARLDRDDYLRSWRESGIPLRYWLWRGLRFHVHERRRDDARLRTVPELDDRTDSKADDPVRHIDRAFATAMVRAALKHAEARCRADGYAEHWGVFERVRAHGERLSGAAQNLGIPVERATVMLRAPTRRFREALVEVLVADGIPRPETPRAMRRLLDSCD